MKLLYITHANARYLHGSYNYLMPSRFISELPRHILNENIEGNIGADASSYNQIDFDLSTKNGSYGPGFLRAKQNGINGINSYKKTQYDNNILNTNIEFNNGQRGVSSKIWNGPHYLVRWR